MKNFLSKHSSSIKTGLIVLLFMLSGYMFIQHRQATKQNRVLQEKITSITVERRLLEEDNKKKEKTIRAYEKRIKILRDSVITTENVISILEEKSKSLEEEIGQVHEDYKNKSVEEIYSFLTESAYPQEGDGEYPFNDNQVREIGITYNENYLTNILNESLNYQIDQLKKQIGYKDSIDYLQKDKIEMLTSMNQNNLKVLEGEKELKEEWQKKALREEKWKRIWKIVSGSEAVIIATIIVMGII